MFFENLEQTVGNGLMKLLTAKQSYQGYDFWQNSKEEIIPQA